MPLNLEGKTVPFTPQRRIELWGVKVPVIRRFEDFPLGARTRARDLIASYDGRSFGEFVLRLFCLATEANINPEDHITYEQLSRLNLTAEAYDELSKAAAEVTREFLENLASNYREILSNIQSVYDSAAGGDIKNAAENTATTS